MKRWGLTAIVGTLAGLLLLPAASSAAEVKGGLKAGLNVAFIHGSDVNHFPYLDMSWVLRFGYCLGGYITVDLSETAALQAEALVTTKGSKEVLIGWGEPVYECSLKTSYLEIPLLFKLMTRPSRRIRLFGLAGPALGIKLGGRLSLESEPLTSYGFRATDLGLVTGIGAIANRGIMWELRWTWGLSKIIKAPGTPPDVKNGVISFITGYQF